MGKFLGTSATSYHLEELIKNSRDRLIIISPYLKINPKIKALIEDKNRLKLDIRLVYGKSELSPSEINWLKNLEFVRTSFCKNLHAKCYLNESEAIITSLNLYEFSQVSNEEMGVYLQRDADNQMYQDCYEDALRIIRISEEIRMSVDSIEKTEELKSEQTPQPQPQTKADTKPKTSTFDKLTTSKLATERKMNTQDLLNKLMNNGCLKLNGEKHYLTDKGKKSGGEYKTGKFGSYFIWPDNINID